MSDAHVRMCTHRSYTLQSLRRTGRTCFLRPAQGQGLPAQGADLGPALAFCLAMKLGGDKAEREALQAVLNGTQIQATLTPRLAEFLTAAREIGGPIGVAALRRASALAEALAP